MTRIPQRSRLVAAIRAALRPSTATAAAVTIALATAGSAQAGIENGAPGKQALRPENQAARDEILFMDAHVVAPEQLLVGTKQGVETIILEEGRDALEQITEVLENRHPVAVHIVAHGESGKLQLGDTWLDAKRLDDNVALIRRWFADTGHANKPDLLLYACKLAEGAEGVALIEKLAEIAGADVAASDDITGIDGDWDLEVMTGDIEAELAFSEITIDDYKANLVTFVVDTTADGNDGECGGASGDCTLREAIEDANDNANGPGVVDVVEASGISGTIELGCEEYGDIDVYDDVIIEGSGMTSLTIDGDGEFTECRIFNIESAENVTVSDVRLQYGDAGSGGCIESTATDLTLNEVYFYLCESSEDGGGVSFSGSGDTLTIRDSVFYKNYAGDEGGDDGGAVFFSDETGGTLLVESSTFYDNFAYDEGGGLAIFADDTDVTIRDSDFENNSNEADGEGGAIFFEDEEGSTFLVENGYFDENDIDSEGANEGGAIFLDADNTEITIRDSVFNGNDAYEDGGAIGFEDSSEGAEASEMLVENSDFIDNNEAEYGDGGAINFDTYADSTLTIQYSLFDDNQAYGDGGALNANGESGDVIIRNSVFSYNEANTGENGDDGGGASFIDLDSVSIYASTFYDNYANDAGGAWFNNNESVLIVNSTFSYNDAYDEGGGLRFAGNDAVSILHTTIAFNTANEADGGGIDAGSDTITVRNTIVSDNTAGTEGQDVSGGTLNMSFSLIQDTDLNGGTLNNLGGNVFGISADLGPLDDTLGPTPAHVPNPEDNPVVDGGDPGFVSPPTFDQTTTVPRVLGAATDMGSIEQEGVLRIIPTLSRIGMMLMGLMLAGVAFLGFRRKDRES